MNVTDEHIAAYADGELEGETLAAVEAAIATDPALGAKVEAHRKLKNTLSAHFAPVADQPVPDHLAALLKPKDAAPIGFDQSDSDTAEVVSFAKERQKRGLAANVRSWGPIAGGALAASLVLALIQPWSLGDTPDGYAGTQLAAALDDQLVASQDIGAPTRILISFENDGGELCRAYRSGESGGIACRDDTGWEIAREFALDGAAATEFRQAGSEADIMAAVQAMAAGEALSAEAEAAAKDRGWR